MRISNDPELILEKAHEYYKKEDFLKAQTLYELVLNVYRGTREAEELFYRYAYTYYYQKQYQLSAHYFKSFANTFAYSEYREEAIFMTAYSNYHLSPVFRLDQESTNQAIQDFQDFVNQYPNSDKVAQCNDLIDELRAKLEDKAFYNGELYFDLNQHQAAIRTFENLLKDFPDTERAEYVRFLILKSAYQYADNSVYDKKQERFEFAIEKYQELMDKFPGTKYSKEAKTYYLNSQSQLKNIAG